MKLVGIHCKELIVKFKQGSNQGDQRLRYSEVDGSCTAMCVTREGDMLVVYYYRQQKDGLFILKTIHFNFERVQEYACEKIEAVVAHLSNAAPEARAIPASSEP